MGSALLALRPPKLFSAREAYELALQRRPGDKFFSKQLAKVVERQSSEAWCSPDAGGRARSCFIENAAHMQAIFALLGVRLRLRLRLRLRGALPPSSPPIRYSISCESFSRCHSLLLTYVCAAHPSIDRLNAPFSPLLCRSPPPCPSPPACFPRSPTAIAQPQHVRLATLGVFWNSASRGERMLLFKSFMRELSKSPAAVTVTTGMMNPLPLVAFQLALVPSEWIRFYRPLRCATKVELCMSLWRLCSTFEQAAVIKDLRGNLFQ